MAKVKRFAGLDCSAPADKMIRLVLRAQLNGMCALGDHALDWSDVEGVHDMRVLSRRLRSAISDFKPYLRKPSLPRLKLRAIAKRLGAVRDEDVALMALEELKSRAREQVAEGIEILAEERRERREDARALLEAAIRTPALDEFRREFLTKVRAITLVLPKHPGPNQTGNPTPSFTRVGVEVINVRLKELISASRCLYSPFEIEKLHELRILAKGMRYALELFAVCWGEEFQEIAKQIAQLQTSLGELHDCDVWMENLGARLRHTARKDKSDEGNMRLREGATWLLRHFARKRMEHYRDALGRWQRWEVDGFIENLKSLLAEEMSKANQAESQAALVQPQLVDSNGADLTSR